MRTRKARLAAAVVLVASVPFAVSGLSGQYDAPGLPRSELDYVVRPLVSGGLLTAVGVVALLSAVASAALLLRATRLETVDGRMWEILVPLILAGVIVGYGYHVATAGVIGANIGYGFVLMIGSPLVAVLVLAALLRAWVMYFARTAGD